MSDRKFRLIFYSQGIESCKSISRTSADTAMSRLQDQNKIHVSLYRLWLQYRSTLQVVRYRSQTLRSLLRKIRGADKQSDEIRYGATTDTDDEEAHPVCSLRQG